MGIWQQGMTLKSVEREIILDAYKFFDCNKEATARALGISTKGLYNKIEAYKKDDEKLETAKRKREEKLHEELCDFRGSFGEILTDEEHLAMLNADQQIKNDTYLVDDADDDDLLPENLLKAVNS